MAKVILIEGNGCVAKALEAKMWFRHFEDREIPCRVVCFPDDAVPSETDVARETGIIIINTQQIERYDGGMPVYPWKRITVQGAY